MQVPETAGLFTLFCYDEEGYNVGTFYVGVRTNSSADKFKVEGWTIISKSTVKIDIELSSGTVYGGLIIR